MKMPIRLAEKSRRLWRRGGSSALRSAFVARVVEYVMKDLLFKKKKKKKKKKKL